MKRMAFILVSLCFFSCATLLNGSDSCVTTYTNKFYGYTIKVPTGWDRAEMMLGNAHQFIAARNGSTSIVVTTMDASKSSIEKVYNDKRWELWERDPSMKRLIEENVDSMGEGKIAVLNYKSKNGRMIHRILIKRTSKWIFIVECRAPESTLYRLERHFNRVFSSFSPGTSEAGNFSSNREPVDREAIDLE